jgi:hypothetical protein
MLGRCLPQEVKSMFALPLKKRDFGSVQINSRCGHGERHSTTKKSVPSLGRELWFESIVGSQTFDCSNSLNYVDGFQVGNTRKRAVFLRFRHSPGRYGKPTAEVSGAGCRRFRRFSRVSLVHASRKLTRTRTTGTSGHSRLTLLSIDHSNRCFERVQGFQPLLGIPNVVDKRCGAMRSALWLRGARAA